jgi:phage shock protein C
MDGGQLTRSVSDRKIAGVCGGLGQYFGVDPTLVRIGFVLAALMGFGLLAYVVLWIVLPRGEPGAAPVRGRRSSAIRIAEERYARGEISAEELARIRDDLS